MMIEGLSYSGLPVLKSPTTVRFAAAIEPSNPCEIIEIVSPTLTPEVFRQDFPHDDDLPVVFRR